MPPSLPASDMAAAVTAAPTAPDTADDRSAFAPPSLRHSTSGPSLTAGVGTPYGGELGGRLAYDFVVGAAPVSLAPFVGAGYAGGEHGGVLAMAFGVQAALGRRHRLALEVSYGPVATHDLSLHGTYVATRELGGADVELGYEYVAASGFVLRLSPLGVAHVLDAGASPPERASFVYSPSAGVGWKLW